MELKLGEITLDMQTKETSKGIQVKTGVENKGLIENEINSPQDVHGSHVMKTICKLDKHHTWIINHSQQHHPYFICL